MARYAYEGFERVWWLTACANIAAPTVAEINAGTDLTGFVPKDGIQRPSQQNMVDSATIKETFDAQVVGSWGGAISLTMYRDKNHTPDTAWNLCVYGTDGYLVFRDGVAVATAPTAGQKVEVYPSQMHEPVMAQTAANEQARFTEQFAVTAQPNKRATVAAL